MPLVFNVPAELFLIASYTIVCLKKATKVCQLPTITTTDFNVSIPYLMVSEPVRLVFQQFVTVPSGSGLVPYFHFKIVAQEEMVGHINFKVGDNRHIRLYAGHLGYGVLPEYRGRSYAYFACKTLEPFIRKLYNQIIITADPDNKPSIRIIEKLKARFLNEIEVPVTDPCYKTDSHIKRRYAWTLGVHARLRK